MRKIKGTIDRFEEGVAVIRNGGEDILIPKKYLDDFSEGDSVAITIASSEEDTEDAAKVAKSLVGNLFKEK